jgi:hypothetical protein
MQIKRLLIVIFLTLLNLITLPVHSKDKEPEISPRSRIPAAHGDGTKSAQPLNKEARSK